ncbi:MAG: DUF4198 domain-containing protein [Phycisphaerales bacterium]|nr:DUF4198 domain-containing protein [Phycisphaerales bacterium]
MPAYAQRRLNVALACAAILSLGIWPRTSGSALLAADSVLQPATLSVPARQPLELTLRLPNGESWSAVNVGRFIVREQGLQRSVEPPIAATRDTLSLSFDKAGYALVALDVGPASEKDRRDSWRRTTHCTKLFVHITGEGEKNSGQNPGLTAKVGSRIELLPLMDPTQLAPGADLPVRAYFDGDKVVGGEVTALAPDGTSSTVVTDSVGATHFRMGSAGRWTIRFTHVSEGETYVAEMLFDVNESPPAPQPAPPSGSKKEEK